MTPSTGSQGANQPFRVVGDYSIDIQISKVAHAGLVVDRPHHDLFARLVNLVNQTLRGQLAMRYDPGQWQFLPPLELSRPVTNKPKRNRMLGAVDCSQDFRQK